VTTRGRNALARVLKGPSAEIEQEVTEEQGHKLWDAMWPDFKAAVAGAQAEPREAEAEGTLAWMKARQPR
jgi:hypothetical protein